VTRPITRQPSSSYRPWLVALGFVLCGFAVLILVRPPRPADPKEEAFVEPTDPSGPAPDGMVWVPGGPFWMGYNESGDGDAPVHRVGVSGFWMDQTEVTNAQFAEFVKATGYKTVAEREPTAEDYGGRELPPDKRQPFSINFEPVPGDVPLKGPWRTPHPPWWVAVPGADWRHPEGPSSTIEGRMNHPVVHVAWHDAVEYAKWAGKRLPTEAEWECAARGGLDRQEFCWGSERQGAGGKWRANTYQGKFPSTDTGEDGFTAIAPVRSFPANGYGLYDMSGNVWEWCADWYAKDYYFRSPRNNPKGPEVGDERDDSGQPARVKRGGSYLCADNYCRRYLPGTRYHGTANDAAVHTGFRCVKDK
jgi:formylglycine-generating enzyme